MCWSGEASAALAITGLATAGLVAYRRDPAPLWIALGYFSLMEALQAFTYGVIDKCALPSNQIATILGYLHISFQPFFINMLALYFIPKDIARKLAPWVYTICLASAVIMIIQLFPFDWAGQCDPRRPLCATRLCSVHGNWHIAWDVPTNGIGNYFVRDHFDAKSFKWAHWPGLWNGFPTYVIAGFWLPFLYGSWRLTSYHFIMGPTLAGLTTNNLNEWPAVWCLLSIGILMVAVKTPLREWLHVRSWFLWPRKYRDLHR